MKNILFCLAALVTACFAQDLGYIDNLIVVEIGPDYITIGWDFVEGDAAYTLNKYSLVIDDDLTTEFKCTSSSCTRLVDYLEPCIEHTFDLTPIFSSTDGVLEGDVANTTGYTEDAIPGPVSSITVTDDTDDGTTLTWSVPSANEDCVAYYDVCYRLEGETTQDCVSSNTAQVTLVGLSACGLYHVYVTPITPSNNLGAMYDDTFRTRDGVPGEPQDVVVGLITPETIQLLWNDPITNFLCVKRYIVTVGEVHTTVLGSHLRGPNADDYDNELTLGPLDPCTDYSIDISSANEDEETSDKVVRYASTEETDPLAPPFVTVTPNGPYSIEVNWGDNENDRCAGSFEVCWNDGVHPVEQCEEVGGDGDNSLIIHDLLPCSMYDIIVSVVSPNGTFTSNSTSNSTTTDEVRPGPVVDLRFESVEVNQLTISYLPPEEDPQCVKEIVTRIIDDNQRLRWNKATTVIEETITGLKACTDYTVQVSTVSPSGLLESLVEEISNTTLDDMPSAPQELGANTITTTSITLQWYQPAENPRCVTAYLLTWGDSANNNTVTIYASTFKVEYTVDGLSACTTYDFTLTSDSIAGESMEATLTQSTACSST